ncbi:unnamed protein product, partial [Adineta steineri]
MHCNHNRSELCSVELLLQVQSNNMSMEFWCQSPAVPFMDSNQFHSCILPIMNITKQPSITMIINSNDTGKLFPIATANFTYFPEYSIKKHAKLPIVIQEDIRSRKKRDLKIGKIDIDVDDAVESEYDDPECTNYNNGGFNLNQPESLTNDDQPVEAVDFATDVITDDDPNEPLGEIDDTLAQDCTIDAPLYGNPNVEWIRVAGAPDLKIDQRINKNIDPDSDGIDFPKMKRYILLIRMKIYIYLQFVVVPSSNVNLLYVIAHYDSGRARQLYHSKVQQNPIVENFLTIEPIKFFEVHLNSTDDDLPPNDVTLNVGYCVAPQNTHPVVINPTYVLDDYIGTIDVDIDVNVNEDSKPSSASIIYPSVPVNALKPSGNLVSTVDVSIDSGNSASQLNNIKENLKPQDDIITIPSSVIADTVDVPSINVPVPSDSLMDTVNVDIDVSGSISEDQKPTLLRIRPQETIIPKDPVDTPLIITNPNDMTNTAVETPAVSNTIDINISQNILPPSYSIDTISSPTSIYNILPPMITTQAPAFYSCYQNLQITQNINVQNLFDLNSPQQTSIDDCINSQSTSSGYSFQSHHYPYQTIVINLRVNIYVQALTLGSQSNVQRYGLRLYNPLRNVDDTYYSSLVPQYGNQPSIVGIPLAKVAIRLYLNLYTTNDGRPPRNIKIVIHGCFDTSSSIDRDSGGRIGGQYYRSPDVPQLPLIPTRQRVPSVSIPVVNSRVETIYSDIRTPYDVNENSIPQYDDAPPTMMIDNSPGHDQIVSQSDAATLDINVEIDVPSGSDDQPILSVPSGTPSISYYRNPVLQTQISTYNILPPMKTIEAPAFYSCYQNLQITQNINVQNIFDLNSPQQTNIDDCINSQSTSPGYSFQSHHYPYQTIVINLRVNIYVQALTLGSQSNVQRYGLRLYNPLRNVDDTYYSSLVPEYGNQPSIVGIPLAKVAIRLYLNLYTTNDGRPPSNIKIVIHGCFDTSSSIDRGSSGRIGGQYYRSPDVPQLPLIPIRQQQSYIVSYASPAIPVPNVRLNNIISTVDVSIDNKPSNSIRVENREPELTYSDVRIPDDINTNLIADSDVDSSPVILTEVPSDDLDQFTSDESSNIDIPTSSLLETIDVNVDIETPSVADPNSDYPQFVERVKTPVVPLYPSPKSPLPTPIFNYLPPMKTTQAPAFYSCYQNLQITQNINLQNIFDLNSPQQTNIDDCINSQSTSSGYSFQSHHYPYQTIVINLRVNIYVQALTLGSQSNVQRYGLRLYNPLRNVDDTYYSSLVPEYGNQPSIVGIPLAKVAIRLYLNLYTTNDGRPPRNIKIVIHGCFDTSSSVDRDSGGRIGGQYYRSPDVPQLPFIPTESQDPLYGPAESQIPSTSLLPSPNKPIPFSRKPGQCFEQILIIGGSHITMIRSRNPLHQIVGPEINFGGTGYTFSLPSDTYEFEVHFVQPFTMKYVFIPYSANVESFKVEASHAGMLAVFTSKNTNDGLVVDGFPTMLISMLVITITHTTDGYLPSHITFSIGVCNPIYSPSNEGNEISDITDCTSQLRLLGNPKQVTRVDIKTPKKHMKAT